MAEHTEWTVQPRPPGWWARQFATRPGDRPAPVPVVLVALGVVAFVTSLAMDWVTISLREPETPNNQVITESTNERAITESLVNSAYIGLVYVLAMVVLLALVAALVGRPAAALRHRMALTGAGAGLAAVVAAGTVRLADDTLELYGFNFPGAPSTLGSSYELGPLAALAAVLLPVAAVWAAAQPAARAARTAVAEPVAADLDEDGEPHVDAPPPVEPRGWSRRRRRAEELPGPPGPPDLTVTPDVLHR